MNDEDGDKDGRWQMEDEDEYDAQDKDGDDGLPWARDRETERRKVSERQRFMRRRRACAVGRSCLAFVASEPIDDRGREASDCDSRACARDDVFNDFRDTLHAGRDAGGKVIQSDVSPPDARHRQTFMPSVRDGRGPPRIGATRACRGAAGRLAVRQTPNAPDDRGRGRSQQGLE